jgi:non-heme chloroperoxidase
MNMRAVGFLLSSLLVLISIAPGSAKEKGPWKDLLISIGDIKIHCLDAGSGDRTLVFTAGWTIPAEVWKDQISYFSSRGFRVLAYDPRSHGLTTKTESGNTYRQQAADLHALLKVLKIDHSYLIGWDTGVTMLLEYVSSPETFKPEKIVFIGGSPAALKMDDYPGSSTLQQARSLLLEFQDDRAKATDKYVRSLFRANQPEYLYSELAAGSLKTPIGAAISLLFDQYTGDRRFALSHVSVPALIFANSDNRLIGEYFKSKIKRATLEVVEGAGSALFLDKPQAFNQALESFFGEH